MSTETPQQDENSQPAHSERDMDLAPMESQEIKQKRRLTRILDAQDFVEDRANKAWEMYVTGEISEDAKDLVILRAVKTFIREILTLLREHARDRHENDKPALYLGPADADCRAIIQHEQQLGRLRLDHDEDIIFCGLADILHSKEFYHEEWTESVQQRHGPDGEQQRSESHTIPEEISWAAYERAREFLAREKDLEIQFEDLGDDLGIWGFEEVDDDEVE